MVLQTDESPKSLKLIKEILIGYRNSVEILIISKQFFIFTKWSWSLLESQKKSSFSSSISTISSPLKVPAATTSALLSLSMRSTGNSILRSDVVVTVKTRVFEDVVFKPVMMSTHAQSKRRRLKMQYAEMIRISSKSTTGSTTGVS